MNVKNILLWFCICHSTFAYGGLSTYAPKPNIIIIVADDMGFNDVSFHGSNQIITPNIDALAYNGIILNRHYTSAMCTPSRAALLTGKYPIHNGMQHYVIPNDEPWGLPLEEKIMPQILKQAGYSSYLVGKWHLGFHQKAFLPTKRGFDYHFGYYGGYIDYYKHYLEMIGSSYAPGDDMRRNLMAIANETKGVYATDLFTDEAIRVIHQHDRKNPMFLYLPHLAPHAGNEDNPYQAPPQNIQKFRHIKDPMRRTYAAMIDKIDESVGRVIQALYDTQMLHNSIVLFFSDNGAPTLGMHANRGSNLPFRGQKASAWEGGLRTPAFVWSPYFLSQHQSVSDKLVHVTDWLPTIAASAGIKIAPELAVDGFNIWEQLQHGYPTERWQIIHNIDEIFGYSSYMKDNWKYVNGSQSSEYNGWLGVIANETDPRAVNYATVIMNSQVNQVMQRINNETYMKDITVERIIALRKKATVECPTLNLIDAECRPTESPCLFDLKTDPCERYNLAEKYPEQLARMAIDVEFFRLGAMDSVRVPADPKCDPRLYNMTWTWWQDQNSAASNRVESVMAFGIIFVFWFLQHISKRYF